MKIRYSRHSVERFKKRGISKSEVEDALIKAQSRILQPHGTIKSICSKFGKKLVVVYHQDKEIYKIVTAYYL